MKTGLQTGTIQKMPDNLETHIFDVVTPRALSRITDVAYDTEYNSYRINSETLILLHSAYSFFKNATNNTDKEFYFVYSINTFL
jgi:hypothetical protein